MIRTMAKKKVGRPSLANKLDELEQVESALHGQKRFERIMVGEVRRDLYDLMYDRLREQMSEEARRTGREELRKKTNQIYARHECISALLWLACEACKTPAGARALRFMGKMLHDEKKSDDENREVLLEVTSALILDMCHNEGDSGD